MSFTATLTLTWSTATAAARLPAATTGRISSPTPCQDEDSRSACRHGGARSGGERLATRLADAMSAALRQVGLGTTDAARPVASADGTPAAEAAPSPAPADRAAAVQDFAQALADALRGGLRRGHHDTARGHHGHHGHHGMAYGGLPARLETVAARYAAPQDPPVTAVADERADASDEVVAAVDDAGTTATLSATAAATAPAAAAEDTLLQAFSRLFAAAGGGVLADGDARGKLAEFLSALAQGLRGDAANDDAMPTVGGLLNVAA